MILPLAQSTGGAMRLAMVDCQPTGVLSVTELTKMIAAAALIAVGFFSATLFGVPEPTAPSSTDAAWSPQQLEPIDEAGPLSAAPARVAWDSEVAPAAHVGAPSAEGRAVQSTRLEQPPVKSWHWSERETNVPPRAMSPLPEIRRASAAPPAPSVQPDRFASLAPPLLSATPPSPKRNTRARFPEAPRLSESDTKEWGKNNFSNRPLPIEKRPGEGRSMSRDAPLDTELTEAKWHVVTDGDSLAKLAAHYLRDESRAGEIYELNRDQLADPDLLPIGAELRIPQRRAVTRQVEVLDSFGAAKGEVREQRRMTRLPELPAHVTAAPRARLQKPLTAKFAGG